MSYLPTSFAPQVHLAVIGMTTRADCVDLLEKRLKSRFSARQVLLQPLAPQNAFALLRSSLALPEGKFSASFTKSWDACASATLNDLRIIEFVLQGLRAGRSGGWLVSWMSAGLSRLSPASPRLSPDLLLWQPLKFSLSSTRSDAAAVDLSIVEVLVLSCIMRSQLSKRRHLAAISSSLNSGSDGRGGEVDASARRKRVREVRNVSEGICFSNSFSTLKALAGGADGLLLAASQKPAASASPVSTPVPSPLQQAAETQEAAVTHQTAMIIASHPPPQATSNVNQIIHSANPFPRAIQTQFPTVSAGLQSDAPILLLNGVSNSLVPVRQLAGTRIKRVSQWPVPYPPMPLGQVSIPPQHLAPSQPLPQSATSVPVPSLTAPAVPEQAVQAVQVSPSDEKSHLLIPLHPQVQSQVQPRLVKQPKQPPIQATQKPAPLTILLPPAALPPRPQSSALPHAPARSTQSRWQIEENSALRALETLVDLDLVRFSGAPPSKLLRTPHDASTGSGAGGSNWSGLEAEKAREALRWAPLEVDEAASRTALERAIRSGRVPTDIARWVVSSTVTATTALP